MVHSVETQPKREVANATKTQARSASDILPFTASTETVVVD